MPDITPVVVILNGQPVSSINPLPTSGGGGGGGGIVEQGKQGSIASPWFVQPTADGATVSLPLPTGAATDAKQDTGNASLASIDGKVATAANQTSGNTTLTSILGQLDSKTSTLATQTTAQPPTYAKSRYPVDPTCPDGWTIYRTADAQAQKPQSYFSDMSYSWGYLLDDARPQCIIDEAQTGGSDAGYFGRNAGALTFFFVYVPALNE